MRLFSKASEYGIRAMIHALETDCVDNFSPRDVCAAAGIPEAFTRKPLGEMAKAHILKGTPGPGGGYRLVRDLSEVSLLDIVVAVDGENAFTDCPLGLRCGALVEGGGYRVCATCTLPEPQCGLGHVCPMHKLWKEVKLLVMHHLETTTLQDIRDRAAGGQAGSDD
jgi:Rrf2 family protein